MEEWRIAHGQPVARSRQGSLPFIRWPADGGKRLPTHPADLRRGTGLRHHFRGRRDVYVSGNLLLYYQKGNPRAAVAPDVFVVLGVANAGPFAATGCGKSPKGPTSCWRLPRARRTAKTRDANASCTFRWACGSTGNTTRRATTWSRPLQGLELSAGEYRRLPGRELADGTLALASGVLGLGVAADGAWAALPRSGDRTGPAEPRGKPTRRVSARSRRGSANGRRGKRRRRASHRKRRPASRKPRRAQPRKHGWPSWRRLFAPGAR